MSRISTSRSLIELFVDGEESINDQIAERSCYGRRRYHIDYSDDDDYDSYDDYGTVSSSSEESEESTIESLGAYRKWDKEEPVEEDIQWSRSVISVVNLPEKRAEKAASIQSVSSRPSANSPQHGKLEWYDEYIISHETNSVREVEEEARGAEMKESESIFSFNFFSPSDEGKSVVSEPPVTQERQPWESAPPATVEKRAEQRAEPVQAKEKKRRWFSPLRRKKKVDEETAVTPVSIPSSTQSDPTGSLEDDGFIKRYFSFDAESTKDDGAVATGASLLLCQSLRADDDERSATSISQEGDASLWLASDNVDVEKTRWKKRFPLCKSVREDESMDDETWDKAFDEFGSVDDGPYEYQSKTSQRRRGPRRLLCYKAASESDEEYDAEIEARDSGSKKWRFWKKTDDDMEAPEEEQARDDDGDYCYVKQQEDDVAGYARRVAARKDAAKKHRGPFLQKRDKLSDEISLESERSDGLFSLGTINPF